MRYPRGAGAGVAIEPTLDELPWGRGEVRRQSSLPLPSAGAVAKGRTPRLAILAFGTMLHPALAAAETLDATVANMRFVKPLDVDLLVELARSHEGFVTIEEGCVMGGAGSAVLEALQQSGITLPVLVLGLPDIFSEHGDPGKLLSSFGLDAAGIEQSVLKRFGARASLVPPVRPAANS